MRKRKLKFMEGLKIFIGFLLILVPALILNYFWNPQSFIGLVVFGTIIFVGWATVAVISEWLPSRTSAKSCKSAERE